MEESMAAKGNKVDQDKDVIYVINKFDGLTTFNWKNGKIVLPYNTPVAVDFTDDPNLVSNLLQCPQLQVCTKKELAAFKAREIAKAAALKVETTVADDSEVEKLLEEGENE
jgi:hypothetical protein